MLTPPIVSLLVRGRYATFDDDVGWGGRGGGVVRSCVDVVLCSYFFRSVVVVVKTHILEVLVKRNDFRALRCFSFA